MARTTTVRLVPAFTARLSARLFAGLAALLLAGCTVGSAAPSSSASTPPAASSAAPTGSSSPAGSAGTVTPRVSSTPSAPPPRPSRRLHLSGTVRMPLQGQTYGRGLVLWGRYAAWAGCTGCQRSFEPPHSLYVADLQTRTVRRIETTGGGAPIVPVGGSGSVLVYGVGTGTDKRPGWTLKTLDLSGGSARTVPGATPADGGLVPVAVVGHGQVAWQTLAPGSPGNPHGPVTALDLRTGARSTPARDLPGRLVALTRAGLIYRTEQPPDDAVMLRAGRDPLVLSETHDVADLVADDTTVVWQTADGAGASVWAAPLDGRSAGRLYYRGGTGDRAVGTGFLAVVTAGDDPVLLMFPLSGGPVAAIGDVPGEFDSVAADGSRLAYLALPPERGVQPDAKHPITLVAGTVELPAG